MQIFDHLWLSPLNPMLFRGQLYLIIGHELIIVWLCNFKYCRLFHFYWVFLAYILEVTAPPFCVWSVIMAEQHYVDGHQRRHQASLQRYSVCIGLSFPLADKNRGRIFVKGMKKKTEKKVDNLCKKTLNWSNLLFSVNLQGKVSSTSSYAEKGPAGHGAQSLEKNHASYWQGERLEFSEQKKVTINVGHWDGTDQYMVCMHFSQIVEVSNKGENVDPWIFWLQRKGWGSLWTRCLTSVFKWEEVKVNSPERGSEEKLMRELSVIGQ